jgi:hypothetical protein
LDGSELDYRFSHGFSRLAGSRRGSRGDPQGPEKRECQRVINWRIAGNPLNWATVLLMFYIAVIGVDFVVERFERKEI